MELWIRSQDRETLVKANALYVMDNQIWNEVPFYENHKKIGLTISGHNHKLAQYKTKERALEVLDEIQKKLVLEQYQHITSRFGAYTGLTNYNISYKDNYVYEMPKE